MKKIFILIIIFVVAVSTAFAQVAFNTMEDSFSTFSNDIANILPYASTIGLNWSDATVRSYPQFGIGLTYGAVVIPTKVFTNLADTMGFEDSLPKKIADSPIGVSLPVYTLEARVGGSLLPFDVGVKLGYISPEMVSALSVSIDYILAGFDIRVPIIKKNSFLPFVSFGIGYNYLKSGIETSIDAGLDKFAGTDTGNILLDTELDKLSFSDPRIRFQMESNVIDFKLQVSKNFSIITPYAGVGYAYGWSSAGGGISSEVLYSGTKITSAQIKDMKTAFEQAGEDAPELTTYKILVSTDVAAGAFRAFGGLSVNLFIFKLDLNAMYNIPSQSLGASANVRIAF